MSQYEVATRVIIHQICYVEAESEEEAMNKVEDSSIDAKNIVVDDINIEVLNVECTEK
jgi:predicted metal-dependent TIM-barrel fold hydrolase